MPKRSKKSEDVSEASESESGSDTEKAPAKKQVSQICRSGISCQARLLVRVFWCEDNCGRNENRKGELGGGGGRDKICLCWFVKAGMKCYGS